MLRPGRYANRPFPRPFPRVGGTGWPIPPALMESFLQGLAQAITSGVTQVDYGDRSVKFASLDDLLRAWEWGLDQLGLPGANPVRRVAAFSKGLQGGMWAGGGGIEHAEYGPDALFSRQVAPDPARVDDVDWERAK